MDRKHTIQGGDLREEVLTYVLCPHCGSSDLGVIAEQRNCSVEIRMGSVVCGHCSWNFPIREGILDFLPRPSVVAQREIAGWRAMLGETSDSLIRTMLSLPYLDDDIWVTTAANFDQIVEMVDAVGKRVLDIGAGRAWSSWRVLQAGAAYVLATDIMTQRYIGLKTADIYDEHSGLYIDRAAADMNQLPLQATSFDLALVNASLHHSPGIQAVMKGIARVLDDGGTALIVGEPVRSMLWPHDLTECPEVVHGINEHAYLAFTCLWAAPASGLFPSVCLPKSIEMGLDQGSPVTAQELESAYAAIARIWRHRVGRWALRGFLLPLLYAVANTLLFMVARKLRRTPR